MNLHVEGQDHDDRDDVGAGLLASLHISTWRWLPLSSSQLLSVVGAWSSIHNARLGGVQPLALKYTQALWWSNEGWRNDGDNPSPRPDSYTRGST